MIAFIAYAMHFQFLHAMCLLMLLIISWLAFDVVALQRCESNVTTSRQRRSLKIPDGSSFILTLQLLKALQLNEPSPINLALEFDVLWKIPNESKGLVKKLRRRHRRELYANFELALNSQKLPGKLCLLRSICEAKSALSPKGFSIVEDILRVIFSYPPDPQTKSDDYDEAFRNGDNCDTKYSCPLSLLGLILSYDFM